MRFLRARDIPFWAQVDATLAQTADKSPEYRLVLSDITTRKKAEEELAKTRNLESLGILAGGIAHDFNNLLQIILANISMAKKYTPPASQAFPFLDQAEAHMRLRAILPISFWHSPPAAHQSEHRFSLPPLSGIR